MFHKILVAIDKSAASQRAFAAALEMSSLLGVQSDPLSLLIATQWL